MLVILLVAFCAVCVLLSWRFDLRRNKAASAVRRADMPRGDHPLHPRAAILLQPGLTWVRIHNDDLVSIGTTDFVADVLGELMTVALPRESRSLNRGEVAWALVSKTGRKLEQVMPIDGTVLAVNRDLIRDPGILQRSPYLAGWIMRVQPRSIRSAVRNVRSGEGTERGSTGPAREHPRG